MKLSNNLINIEFGDARATLQAGRLQMVLHNNDNDDALKFTNPEQASKVTIINVLFDYKGKCCNYYTIDKLMELKLKHKFASLHECILLLISRYLKTDCFFAVSTDGLDYQGCYLLIKELRAIQLNTPYAGFLIFTTYEVYHRLFQTKTIEVVNMDDVMGQLKKLHFFEVTESMKEGREVAKSSKYFFKTKDIIAINAYLYQIYLSMHRIGRASYSEFIEYYQKRVMPDKVLEFVNRTKNVPILQSIQPLLEQTIQRQTIQIRGRQVVNPFIVFKNWSLRSVQRGIYLSFEEVQCIVFFLDAFSKLLQSPDAPVPPCDYLHSRIAHFCFYCLEPKLDKESKNACVEHFMQTPSLNCLSIGAIVGDENWYK